MVRTTGPRPKTIDKTVSKSGGVILSSSVFRYHQLESIFAWMMDYNFFNSSNYIRLEVALTITARILEPRIQMMSTYTHGPHNNWDDPLLFSNSLWRFFNVHVCVKTTCTRDRRLNMPSEARNKEMEIPCSIAQRGLNSQPRKPQSSSLRGDNCMLLAHRP